MVLGAVIRRNQMKIGRMLRDIERVGTQLKLTKNQNIVAHPATNQPDYKALGLYFARPRWRPSAAGFGPQDSILLENGHDFLLERERY